MSEFTFDFTISLLASSWISRPLEHTMKNRSSTGTNKKNSWSFLNPASNTSYVTKKSKKIKGNFVARFREWKVRHVLTENFFMLSVLCLVNWTTRINLPIIDHSKISIYTLSSRASSLFYHWLNTTSFMYMNYFFLVK